MFITIGKRDCNLVYIDPIRGHIRWTANEKHKPEDLQRLPVLSPIGIAEVKPKGQDFTKDQDLSNVVGICFPMLTKAITYLNDNKITHLEYLFLISTNRKQLLPKLNEIKESMEKAERIDAVYDYLERGLIKHAQEDNISDTAHLIRETILKNSIPLGGLSIANIVILDLGTYGFFAPILEADLTKLLKKDILKKADINILDFFESETYNALKPYFGILENAKIYLALNAGGMPQMQKGVEQVVKSTVAHAEYEQIYNSEFLWYQLESQPQEEFLVLLRQMTDNVIGLDWDSAYARFISLKTKHANKLGQPTIQKLETLFKRIITSRSESANGRWFDNFSTLILQALYRMNLNDVVVWLKCLEESALDTLLQKLCGKLWQRVETISEGGHKKKRIIFTNEQNQQESLPAYPDVLKGRFGEESLMPAFELFVKVFLEPEYFDNSIEWEHIRKKRNELIHQGVSVNADVSTGKKILQFIDIDPICLSEAIAHLQNGNLNALIDFEKKCMNNNFFGPLRQIAGLLDETYTLFDRKKCEDYLKTLHLYSS